MSRKAFDIFTGRSLQQKELMFGPKGYRLLSETPLTTGKVSQVQTTCWEAADNHQNRLSD